VLPSVAMSFALPARSVSQFPSLLDEIAETSLAAGGQPMIAFSRIIPVGSVSSLGPVSLRDHEGLQGQRQLERDCFGWLANRIAALLKRQAALQR